MKQSWGAQPKGQDWKRSPALGPALEGGIWLSLEAATGPSSNVALGELQLQGLECFFSTGLTVAPMGKGDESDLVDQ